jgi:hypothetical protein
LAFGPYRHVTSHRFAVTGRDLHDGDPDPHESRSILECNTDGLLAALISLR